MYMYVHSERVQQRQVLAAGLGSYISLPLNDGCANAAFLSPRSPPPQLFSTIGRITDFFCFSVSIRFTSTRFFSTTSVLSRSLFCLNHFKRL